MTLRDFLHELNQKPIDPLNKTWSPHLAGAIRGDVATRSAVVSSFSTPVATLDAAAVAHNIDELARWAGRRGWLVAPHGKTTMAPQIWRQQLEAGAWGITVATTAQLRVALAVEVPRIQVADPVWDAAVWDMMVAHLDKAAEHDVIVWADSPEAVRLMAGARSREVTVLVEVGRPGGRLGVRDTAGAVAVRDAILAADGLRLGGTAGYEGAIGEDESPAGDEVRRYLADLVELHRDVISPFVRGGSVLSLGGSDRLADVEEALTAIGAGTQVHVRPGMSVVHDHGLYATSQGDADPSAPQFQGALAVISSVLGVHDDGRAIIDAGRRDLGSDNGMPVALELWRGDECIAVATHPHALEQLNDQHGFVPRGSFPVAVLVGDRIVVGVSHTCTTLDRWRDLAEIDGPLRPTSIVRDLVATYF